MKEIMQNKETIGGGSVKKTLLVAALAVILVFAFCGSAFAAGINHSGQTQLGAHGAPNVNPVAVSQAAIYYPWTSSLMGNVGDNSPHGNFTTTTVKCVVCHAVHYAAPLAPAGTVGNVTVASDNQQADTLLRMRADEACIMCHATAGMSVNGRPLYDGIGPALINNTGGLFNTGHFTGPNCTECHTNVHGAGADHSVASLDGYLLKNMTATNVQGTGATTNNMIQAITTIDNTYVNEGGLTGQALAGTPSDYAGTNTTTLREQAVGVFCAECHLGSYAAAAPGAAANVYGSATAYSGHRIAAAATTSWNATGSISSGAVQNMQVAFAPATNCKSCHDSKDIYGNVAFPHSWGQDAAGNKTKMWLLEAANAGSVESAVGTPSANAYDGSLGNPVQLSDGVCLKCHVASGNTAGVGITFSTEFEDSELGEIPKGWQIKPVSDLAGILGEAPRAPRSRLIGKAVFTTGQPRRFVCVDRSCSLIQKEVSRMMVSLRSVQASPSGHGVAFVSRSDRVLGNIGSPSCDKSRFHSYKTKS